jgi:hypothetical protein
MIDPALLKAVADYAARVIGAVVNADTATRTRWKAAVEQLQDAVLQTQLYVSTLDRTQRPDRTVEEGWSAYGELLRLGSTPSMGRWLNASN